LILFNGGVLTQRQEGAVDQSYIFDLFLLQLDLLVGQEGIELFPRIDIVTNVAAEGYQVKQPRPFRRMKQEPAIRVILRLPSGRKRQRKGTFGVGVSFTWHRSACWRIASV